MKLIYIVIILTIMLFPFVKSYNIDAPGEVHQYLTNESGYSWKLIPFEIKDHLSNPITTDISDGEGFDIGDDTIDGSGEEDKGPELLPFFRHFWQPDSPRNGNYDDGLDVIFEFESSYRRAIRYWNERVIPLYLEGRVDESYYWLGRVAHLLEDAAQPGHVLLDPHCEYPFFCQSASILESYTGSNFTRLRNTASWQGESLEPYDYDNLIGNFNWTRVDPKNPTDRQNIELFRLFWYTAQKTQYWTSDDVNGNQIYRDLNGNTLNWQCGTSSSLNLWKNESYSCSYIINASANLNSNTVDKEANATIPHSMKAVSGLYRLFWDAVHTDWPTFQNNLRRTGFSLRKGDITSGDKVILWGLSQSFNGPLVQAPVISDVDGNLDEGMEILISTGYDSKVKALDGNTNTQLWSFSGIGPTRNIAVDDIDGDGKKEVVAADVNGKVVVLNAKNGNLKWSYSFDSGAEAVSIAIANIDNINEKEVIVGLFDYDTYQDGTNFFPAQVNLYAFDKNGNLQWVSAPIDNGPQFDPAIADIDNDGKLEIVVTTFHKTYALNAEDGSLLWNRPISTVTDAPVIADVDNDNKYEVIVSSYKLPTGYGDCPELFPPCNTQVNAVYVLDGSTGAIKWNRSVDYPAITPSVANLDNDTNLEIVVATDDGPNSRNHPNLSIGKGTLYVFDGKTGNQQWNYTVGGKVETAPAIADIDSDGKLEIVFGAYDGKVYAIDEDGNQDWVHNFGSIVVYSSAIGDVDGDGAIEIMIQHAEGIGENASDVRGAYMQRILNITSLPNGRGGQGGQVITLNLEMMGGKNHPPILNNLTNITANVTQLINLNATGQIRANDSDGDNLTFFYSRPFNSTGYWQTTKNDSGVYSVVVEVSDGNLSDSQTIYVTVISFTPTTPNYLTCNEELCSLNKTFYGLLEINCSGSIDIENDSITYSIDAYYNHTGYNYTGPLTNSTNKFSNGLSTENLTFDVDNLDIVRYLEIPIFANVTSAYLNLSGYNVSIPYNTSQNTENAAWVASGSCDPNNPCSYGYDEDWYTFASSVNNQFVEIDENFSIPNTAIGATAYVKRAGASVGTWVFGCRKSDGSPNNITVEIPSQPEIKSFTIPSICLQTNTLTIYNSVKNVYDATERGSIYYESKIIWHFVNYSYPTNVSLEVGTNDSSPEWKYIGIFNKTNNRTENMASAINKALNNESCDCKGCILKGDNCSIPFLFYSAKPGKLEYFALNVTYNLIPTRYAWKNIGNHSAYTVFNWDLGSVQNQDKIGLRCKSIDLDGGRNYSAYYTPAMNISITNIAPRTGISLVTPGNISSTVGVIKDEFFNVTVNVSCFNTNSADCWKINVSFDRINTTTGAIPFYTNESNPRTIGLRVGESKLVTTFINATGNVSSNHTFFVFANLTTNLSISNITNKWNVTIKKRETTDLTKGNITEDGHILKHIYPPTYSRSTAGTTLYVGASDSANTYRSYIQFNTSFIQDSATIENTLLNLSLYAIGSSSGCGINQIEIKNLGSASNENLYNDIGNGTTYVSPACNLLNGTIDLGSNADTHLQNQLVDNVFGAGIKWSSEGLPGTLMQIYSSESAYDPILIVTYNV